MTKYKIKKTLASAAMSAIFLWSITGTYELEFFTRSGNVKVVNIDIDSSNSNTGDFTAVARDKNDKLWEVVGTVIGDKVELEFANPLGSERIIAVGSISEDGSLTGRAANTNGEEFEWEATDGVATKLKS